MKITRKGADRNAGIFTLVSEDLTQRKIDDEFGPRRSLRWKADSKEVAFTSGGKDRNISYDYEVTLTPAEIVRVVTLAVREASKDVTSRAIGMGALTVLRELLAEKVPKTRE